MEPWRAVFFIAAGIYLVSNLFFVIFAAGVPQPWNHDDTPVADQELKVLTSEAVAIGEVAYPLEERSELPYTESQVPLKTDGSEN